MRFRPELGLRLQVRRIEKDLDLDFRLALEVQVEILGDLLVGDPRDGVEEVLEQVVRGAHYCLGRDLVDPLAELALVALGPHADWPEMAKLNCY